MKCHCVEWSDGGVYGEIELADPHCRLCLGTGAFTEKDQQRLKDMAIVRVVMEHSRVITFEDPAMVVLDIERFVTAEAIFTAEVVAASATRLEAGEPQTGENS